MDHPILPRPDFIPPTQLTIQQTQYASAHHSQYMHQIYGPYNPQYDPNNNAYIGSRSRPQSHISIPQQQQQGLLIYYIRDRVTTE